MSQAPGVMVITGGSRGIGAATAVLAAARGWKIALSYNHRADAAAEIVQACEQAGSQAIAQQCDVSDEASVVAFFARCTAELGTATCLVNVTGAFLCAREAVRHMATDRGGAGGSIVNVSSAASYLGSPNEFVDYAMTKGAMDTMTIGLAKEVADRGIRVNGVRPGLIDTEIHRDAGMPDRVARLAGNVPMQRGGTADEVAALILYLASDDASYITGTNVNVAGGR